MSTKRMWIKHREAIIIIVVAFLLSLFLLAAVEELINYIF